MEALERDRSAFWTGFNRALDGAMLHVSYRPESWVWRGWLYGVRERAYQLAIGKTQHQIRSRDI
jgi:hypothetical protein